METQSRYVQEIIDAVSTGEISPEQAHKKAVEIQLSLLNRYLTSFHARIYPDASEIATIINRMDHIFPGSITDANRLLDNKSNGHQ